MGVHSRIPRAFVSVADREYSIVVMRSSEHSSARKVHHATSGLTRDKTKIHSHLG